ncbi:MAG: hypothetical protein WCF90_03055 [Methanomicrobiales archaeon]
MECLFKGITYLLPAFELAFFKFHQVLKDQGIDERARHPADFAGKPEDPCDREFFEVDMKSSILFLTLHEPINTPTILE